MMEFGAVPTSQQKIIKTISWCNLWRFLLQKCNKLSKLHQKKQFRPSQLLRKKQLLPRKGKIYLPSSKKIRAKNKRSLNQSKTKRILLIIAIATELSKLQLPIAVPQRNFLLKSLKRAKNKQFLQVRKQRTFPKKNARKLLKFSSHMFIFAG